MDVSSLSLAHFRNLQINVTAKGGNSSDEQTFTLRLHQDKKSKQLFLLDFNILFQAT